MRIAVDIDSTLHPYWDQLEDAAWRRFGMRMPYEAQLTWAIDRLRPEQLALCIAETHCDERILAASPYPDAVAVVAEWGAQGHEICVASHRSPRCRAATARWLEAIGLPHRRLACCEDKVAWCVEHEVEVLIDDAPDTLVRASAAGLVCATLEHPWNVDVREEEEILAAPDWRGLQAALAPVLRLGAPSLARS